MDKEKEDLTETVDRTYIAYSLPLPPPRNIRFLSCIG